MEGKDSYQFYLILIELGKCDQYTILSNTTTLKNKTENSNLGDRTQKNWFKKRKKKRVLLINTIQELFWTNPHSLSLSLTGYFTFPSLPRKKLPLVYGHCHCTLNPKPLHHHPSLSSPLEPKPKSSNNLMQKTTTLFMDLPSCTSTSLILPLIVLLATSQGNPPKTKHIAHLPFIANLLSHTHIVTACGIFLLHGLRVFMLHYLLTKNIIFLGLF